MKQSGPHRAPGKRGKTRSKFKKTSPKVSVNDIMAKFNIGDRVQIVVDSSYHSGLPYKAFHGLSGEVTGKRGSGYEVAVLRGNQALTVVTMPVHIKKLN
ncbi:MAG: 50S ribosomal protein L21e [archaeon]